MKASIVLLAFSCALTMASAYAETESAREAAKTKVVSIPDKVQTVIGELKTRTLVNSSRFVALLRCEDQASLGSMRYVSRK